MYRIEVDCRTGNQRIVQLTAAEIAELQSRPEPPTPAELSPVEKLAAVGLTVDDLRALLS